MNIDRLVKRKLRATQNGNLQQLAEITKLLGDAYFENDQPKKALQEYTKQLSVCEDLQDKLNCAIAHRMIGEVNASLENYEQALVHQNLYLEGAREMKNLIEEQRAFATLGRTYFCQAESLLNQPKKHDEVLASAKAAYVKSMELCDKLSNNEIKSEEKILMRARLLLNLGLTLEAQKETQQAIKLIEQATALCVSNNFQEDLHRTCISLAAIYERQGNHELALNYIDSAATVSNVCLKAEAKIIKAELFMRTGQWIKTRQVLVQLYTSSGLSKDINRRVEKYLRIVVTLCRIENSLLVETDIRLKQKLYEKLGDAAVAVQCFDKGAEYYRCMLICAEETGDQIDVALTSLVQTLKDAGRYEEALPLARRELELCTNPRERCRSGLLLAELSITVNTSDEEIREYYDLALRSANESEDVKLQKTAARELISYLKSIGQIEKAEDVERETGMTEASSDTESETPTSEISDEIGADICLEDLSDLEIENIKTTSLTRRRTKRAPAIKRNEKGETQLHVACINGDVSAVEKLLSSGHSTNVRDHCGWSPLHEAANHGHLEIAELLLKHDANVNDSGGAACKGMTPLHDAACCGHFSMMQLLMQHGANLTLKTHNGDTVLDCLEEWRERVEDLSPTDLIEYKTMHRNLSAVVSTSRKKRKRSNDAQSPLARKSTQPEISRISAGEDYKRTIENLRSFNKVTSNSLATATLKHCNIVAPLVNEEEVLLDDWLEDDIGSTKKSISNHPFASKRKLNADSSVENGVKRSKRNDASVIHDEDFDTSEDSSDSTIIEMNLFEEPFTELVEESKKSERKRQVSLLSNGFSVNRIPSPAVDLQPSPHSASSKRYSKEYVNLCLLVKEKTFKVKVEVCENEVEFITCITSAAEQMFFDETGCKAKLTLQLKNRSAVTRETILEILKKDACTGDKIECEVSELQVPSIIERYKTICDANSVIPCEVTLKCLKSCENTSAFRVKRDDTSKESLVPLLKTLEYETSIKLLQLSGAVLSTAGLHLRRCLLNLPSLQELDLNGCDIDYACLSELDSLPPQLRVLNLSYNPLRPESQETLERLITPLKHLQTLNLRSCYLEDFRLPLNNPNLTSCDISWNKLSCDSVISFLNRQLFHLNLSNTLSSFNRAALNLNNMDTVLSLSLESLQLSFCDITDSDVKIIIVQLPRLLKLILKGNRCVSVSSVNALLSRSPTLTYIDVSGCKNIASHPEENLFIQNPEVCTLLANVEPDLCESWIKLWRGTGTVTKLPHNLTIFKPITFSMTENT